MCDSMTVHFGRTKILPRADFAMRYFSFIIVVHKMAESSVKHTKESHSSVSSSGEASGGQTGSPQSSLGLTSPHKEVASTSLNAAVSTDPPDPLPGNSPAHARNAPSSSDTPSPVARRAHNKGSSTNLADSDGEVKQ